MLTPWLKQFYCFILFSLFVCKQDDRLNENITEITLHIQLTSILSFNMFQSSWNRILFSYQIQKFSCFFILLQYYFFLSFLSFMESVFDKYLLFGELMDFISLLRFTIFHLVPKSFYPWMTTKFLLRAFQLKASIICQQHKKKKQNHCCLMIMLQSWHNIF